MLQEVRGGSGLAQSVLVLTQEPGWVRGLNGFAWPLTGLQPRSQRLFVPDVLADTTGGFHITGCHRVVRWSLGLGSSLQGNSWPCLGAD